MLGNEVILVILGEVSHVNVGILRGGEYLFVLDCWEHAGVLTEDEVSIHDQVILGGEHSIHVVTFLNWVVIEFFQE